MNCKALWRCMPVNRHKYTTSKTNEKTPWYKKPHVEKPCDVGLISNTA